ncbi:motility associated factor glycosyltransferase family protein [Metabacillus crassostreae]|uniref:motility associated factor glycosyltransferase family protein n=1 Tax=Metabacillus crassostreae TaxID=929098 RepID=UPI00195CE361|nr:6-hydroxymethylpterin diphosphokinase MptE-like protein [Metabacillus crassostreae]
MQINKESADIIVVGIGLGYHVLKLADKYPNHTIHVFELNLLYMQWLIEKNLHIIMKNKNNIIINQIQDVSFLLKILSEKINDSQGNFFIYKPSLELIPNKDLRITLESFLMKKRTINDQGDSLTINFNLNIQLRDKSFSQFYEHYNNYSTILVSAGPSLAKQLPLLKKASLCKNVVIACVGTALIPLVKAGIKPNLIMISDPKELINEQFEGLRDLDIPLFYLSTANHLAVKQYNGPRFIVWQSGFEKAEYLAEKTKSPLIKTGGSVATCLLDLLIKLGSKKIMLVGQDLAFTNNSSHTKNAHSQTSIKNKINLIEIKGYFQNETVLTSLNLYTYLKWFERYVMEYNDIQFWNCTEGGAYIQGWKHKPLRELLK